MNTLLRIVTFALVAITSLTACGPSAAFRAAQQRAETAPQNAEIARLRAELEREREANRTLATPSAGNDPAAPAAAPAVGGIAPGAVAPAPQMPRLCAGVDQALLNTRSFETMRTESQGFGGVYNPGGNTVNGRVLLQNTRFWMTVVINNQVQSATTGPLNREFGGMILVQHTSGPCLTPAYAPEGERNIRFTPDSVLPGQRLEIRCYARQHDPTSGTWRVGEFVGRRLLSNWDPTDMAIPIMPDSECRRY